MTILEHVRIELAKSRTFRDSGIMSAFLSFVLSEIVSVGKNKGNRETTDDEAIAVLKKMIAVAQSNLAVVTEKKNRDRYTWELNILQKFMPKMATNDEVAIFLNTTFGGTSPSKADVMKALKQKFGTLIDMRAASELYQKMFG